MSATTIAYHLRPNKAIEREIFLDLLGALSPVLPLISYQYVGFGGPFLEDFRLISKRVGLKKLICIERDNQTHARQEFNRFSENLECHLGDLQDILAMLNFSEKPAIVWLDFSDSKNLIDKIQSFVDLQSLCKEGSIIKLTLVASVPKEQGAADARLDRVRAKLGAFFPPQTKAKEVNKDTYPAVLLRAIELAFSREALPNGQKFKGLSSFVYSDGVPMLTLTGILVRNDGETGLLSQTKLSDWEYLNTNWTHPEKIDVPVLSYLEQKELALGRDLEFSIPAGRLGTDSCESYRKYARLYPHFARVDL